MKAPSDFSKTAPNYSIKFSRNQGSKGYYNAKDKKYAVCCIIADFSYENNNLLV